MTGRNSNIRTKSTWTIASVPTEKPRTAQSGTAQQSAQNTATLPKFLCQKCGRNNGQSAMESRIPAKGTAHVNPSELPSMPAAWAGTAVSAPSARIAADMRAEERSVTRYSNLFLVGRCGFAG